MKCNICGREIQNEEANFCEYCGSSFREHKQTSFNMPQKEQGFPSGNNLNSNSMSMQQGNPTPFGNPAPFGNPMFGAPRTAQEEKPISFLNWLISYGLIFIPIVGGLIFFIMLVVWSFNSNTPAGKRNWARATLIVYVLAIIILISYIVNSSEFQQIYTQMNTQMQNGTFDLNTFNDMMNQYQ